MTNDERMDPMESKAYSKKIGVVIEYDLSNREKSMQSTKRKYWCGNCDRAIVGDIGKCPNCSSRTNRKKRK